MTLTDRISALMYEAAVAGDILQAAICARALRVPYARHALTPADRARVDDMTQGEARIACARVLAENEAN